MRTRLVVLCAALAIIGCKKSGTGTGGGGGGWLVGSSSLMAQVDKSGAMGAGYSLGTSEQLLGIACRYSGEAWVVGTNATLLYTNDAGKTWTQQLTPATGDLRALATQDNGPVFIGGDHALLVTTDTGSTWRSLVDGNFRSIAAAQAGDTVLALAEDGAVWSYDGARMLRTQTIAGAHAIAVSPDGAIAMIAGHGIARSTDAGMSWQTLAVDASFDDVRVSEDGSAVAVGAGGAIANIDQAGHVSLQHVGTADLHTVHIADADSADTTGYAAGEGGQVLITRDFGASWTLGPNLGRTVYGVDEIGTGHR